MDIDIRDFDKGGFKLTLSLSESDMNYIETYNEELQLNFENQLNG